MGERICIFITHRLAGVRLSSQVLYGEVTEQGDSQELLDRKGRFYEFYQLQAGLYKRI